MSKAESVDRCSERPRRKTRGGLSERRVRHDNCFNMLVDAHIFTSNLDVI